MVLSNSFWESIWFFPISHINNFTTISLFCFISSTKFSIALMRSTTFIVGHKPFPLSNALHAESSALIASPLPKLGISPSKVGLYSGVDEIVE